MPDYVAAKGSNKRSKKQVEQEDVKTRAFMTLAMERFQLAEDAESKTRAESLNDFEFSIGDQWPADIKTQRTIDARPCLTMDRIQPTILQVGNEQRQQRPSGTINPVGNGADKETADILQGMVRHIEVNSDAEVVYDTAFDHMLRGGFGWWRLVTEFIDDKSWNQEIKLKWIRNPFMVHVDPFANEPDYSDAEWGFIFEDIAKEEYKRQHPNTKMATMTETTTLGDMPPGWITEKSIRIAEYFHAEYETHKLQLLSDGSTALDGNILDGSQATVVKEREINVRRIVWTKINGVERIEETEWPGRFIPIIPVNGIDIFVNGKRYLAGVVRNAKDPQRMYNYWASSATETIALAPKAPWLVAEGQIAGRETDWQESNRRTLAVLQYKQTDVEGRPAPPPQRSVVEPPIQAMTLMLRQAGQDFQQATGIFPPALGDNPADQSGKAIQLLQKRSDVGNVNWTDNLSRSIRHSTRAIIDLIPHIYDAPRIQRIINPDGSVEHVGVYNGTKQAEGAADPREVLEQQGMKKVFDLGKGDYDVVVSVGPSYQTKRQEAAAGQIAMAQAWPQLMNVAPDIILGNLDWPQADLIAERAKKMLPPQLTEDNGEQSIEGLQAQLGQLSKQHQALTQALNQANQIIETKQVENQGKLQVEQVASAKDVQIKLIDERVRIAVAEIMASKDLDKARGEQLFGQLEMAHDAAHDVAMQTVGHQQQMQQMAQQPQDGPQPQDPAAQPDANPAQVQQ